MKSLRTLMGDRLSGGVLAGLVGWLLVLNLFVAAFSCGMSVPVEAGTRWVMCEPGQPIGDEARGKGGETAHLSHDCPYVIGHDGDGLLVAAFAPGADLGPAFAVETALVFAPASEAPRPIDPGRLGLAPAPRGPPSLSA